MTNTEELLPCPFCGGEAKKALIGNDYTKKRSVEVKCTQCFVKRVTAGIRSNHEQLNIWATEAWNKRTDFQ